jgi:hypothetical protein
MARNLDSYSSPRREIWTGRVDEDCVREAFRWHQVVEPLDLCADSAPFDAGTGFAS